MGRDSFQPVEAGRASDRRTPWFRVVLGQLVPARVGLPPNGKRTVGSSGAQPETWVIPRPETWVTPWPRSAGSCERATGPCAVLDPRRGGWAGWSDCAVGCCPGVVHSELTWGKFCPKDLVLRLLRKRLPRAPARALLLESGLNQGGACHLRCCKTNSSRDELCVGHRELVPARVVDPFRGTSASPVHRLASPLNRHADDETVSVREMWAEAGLAASDHSASHSFSFASEN